MEDLKESILTYYLIYI